MKTATIYCRVSTTRQATEGLSLESQRQACLDLCTRNGWEVGSVFVENGASGRSMKKRPQLEAALGEVCQTSGVLVFYSLSRLARSIQDTLWIAEKVQGCKGSLTSVTDAIDTTTPNGRAFFAILAAFARLESEIIGERVKAANAHTVKRLGYRTQGRQEFGYRFDEKTKTVVEDAAEQRIVARVLRICSRYKSNRLAADKLNKLGIPTCKKYRHGIESQWSDETVRRIVARAKANADQPTAQAAPQA